MKQSVVFVLRSSVFVGAVFAKIHFRGTLLEDYSCKTQILLASVQMALVIAALAVFQACQYVVTEITGSANYVSMQAEGTEWDAELEASLEAVGEAAAAEREESPSPEAVCAVKLQVEVIVFASAAALRAYVRKIHTTAVLLWGTFYSIDMGAFSSLYYLVVGLFTGWLVQQCFPSPKAFVSSNFYIYIYIYIYTYIYIHIYICTYV